MRDSACRKRRRRRHHADAGEVGRRSTASVLRPFAASLAGSRATRPPRRGELPGQRTAGTRTGTSPSTVRRDPRRAARRTCAAPCRAPPGRLPERSWYRRPRFSYGPGERGASLIAVRKCDSRARERALLRVNHAGEVVQRGARRIGAQPIGDRSLRTGEILCVEELGDPLDRFLERRLTRHGVAFNVTRIAESTTQRPTLIVEARGGGASAPPGASLPPGTAGVASRFASCRRWNVAIACVAASVFPWRR